MTDISRLRDSFLTLQSSSSSLSTKLQCMNNLITMHTTSIEHWSELNTKVDTFAIALGEMLATQSTSLRTAALRVIRTYASVPNFLPVLFKLRLDVFISRCLERGKDLESDRAEALNVIRAILQHASELVPRGIINTLVALAEQADDACHAVGLSILCEAAVRRPELISLCGGIRTIVQSASRVRKALQETVVITILYLFNDISSRKYLRSSGAELRTALSPLTDIHEIEGVYKEKVWMTTRTALVTMMRSWAGLICLTSDDLCLRAMVNVLRLSNVELVDIVLDAFFLTLRVNIPISGADPFRSMKNTNDGAEEAVDARPDLPSRHKRHDLLDNFTAAVCLALIHCGLPEALIYLGHEMRTATTTNVTALEERKFHIATKATVLLGEILSLSNSLLPPSVCARLQTLPILVNHATSMELDPRFRSRASSMVSHLHQYSHIKETSQCQEEYHTSLLVTGANKWRRVKGVDRRLDRLDDVKMKIEYKMDEGTLKAKLVETNVLATKDHTRWNWELISDLVEGPLTNPQLLTLTLKSTKFLKRILSFLRPSRKEFSGMSRDKCNMKYVRIGCQALETLTQSELGTSFLRDNALVAQIGDYLQQETRTTDTDKKKAAERLFSSEKVLKTMAREYFTMLGTLSSSERGLDVLRKHKIFEMLAPLSSMQGRDDLSHLIMTSLDYNITGPSRILLSKSLTSTSRVVRYLATRHLRVLLRSGVNGFPEWGIKLLVRQLADADTKVTTQALTVLDEAADDMECLEALIGRAPNLLDMGPGGQALMIRFLARSSGFTLLNASHFLQDEMKEWREHKYREYPGLVERSLREKFSSYVWTRNAEESKSVHLPVHFYGELASTREGAALLVGSGHFRDFVAILKEESLSSLERRAAVWTVGHVGRSETGVKLLQQEKLIPYVIQLAESCTCFSLRGACFFALGLIARTPLGRIDLEHGGWLSPSDPFLGIATPEMPADGSAIKFFQIPSYTYTDSWAKLSIAAASSSSIKMDNPIHNEILSHVVDLSNHITRDGAMKKLKVLRTKSPQHFQSLDLCLNSLRLLEVYKFRLPSRRFIHSLFYDMIYWRGEDLQRIASILV
mmetsp:Transcript_15192/g.45499  ORF Transcript_15192/g.45499 Transcript_15192/m.45499 type:complete len:1087 (+) Transcript_15192:76-3336(+)|eukprot:CAMPEP_0177667782 /NCGR_PEP_ID=MMETSP0447-20121125/22326_1 /TAXON_ID=0 /ORGANISM="Stygamoeba regulata, Strain BSH-02190019" /LENGTH=1086 /DNA_ID=CAMNT_0019174075 /DNA_START=123 /DNA_END=3383 /DNA_ORIENTATION=-